MKFPSNYHPRLKCNIVVSGIAGTMMVCGIEPVRAVLTPYDQKPAAVSTQTGLVWDFQLADKLQNRRGRLITVMDSCFSGGFVGNLTSQSRSYAATAANWDELSWSCGTSGKDFGIDFMNASKTNTLHDSFVAATPSVINQQLPQEGGDLGAETLDYLSGDRAILFSDIGSDIEQNKGFWNEINTAWLALTTRPILPWQDSGIEAGGPISVYFGDGKAPADVTVNTPIEREATKENLFAAIDNALKDSNFGSLNNLFLFIDDHGANTDVIKSRHTGTRYDYQVNTSLWRGGTDNAPYGIWKVRHQVFDPDINNYRDIITPKLGWMANIVEDQGAWWMEYSSSDPNDRTSWLDSGIDYDFGYDHDGMPLKVSWEDYNTRTNDPNDWGQPNNSSWGNGATVYGETFQPADDPSQWPGWDNGGDGWVLAPALVPEPSSIFGLFTLAGLGLTRLRQKGSD